MHPMVTSIEEKEKKCFPISRGRKAFMLLLSKVQITLFFFFMVKNVRRLLVPDWFGLWSYTFDC
jgi:hypothetical protein